MGSRGGITPDGASHAATRRVPRIREWVKDLVLGGAALLGVLAVGWMVCAQVTGATIVSFRTGSMAPTLPQGAAAVSFPTAAAELRAGDVVTVRRASDGLPVTHRIVSVAAVPGRPAARELVLRGDANAQVDMAPYVVTEVPRVVWGAAWFGSLLTALAHPWALVGVIALVGVLVTWAFWPPPLEDEQDSEGEGAVPDREAAQT